MPKIQTKYILNIPLLKIKEYENIETWYLFGFLPIYKCSVFGAGRKIFKLLGIKIVYKSKNLSKEQIFEVNRTYEEGNEIYPKVLDRNRTLELLLKSNSSISRFGDGEFNLILGNDLHFQKYSKRLAKRLKEILKTPNSNNIIAIPNIFESLDAYIEDDAHFWRKFLVSYRKNIYNELDFSKQYGDSLVSRPYFGYRDKNLSKEYFEKITKIWKDKNIVVVEGEGTRLGYNNDLLKNCRSVKRILCPAKNSFEKYDEILKICREQHYNTLFILALGPTATVLAEDLSQMGYRALDLGHIDIEYEWFLQKATTKIIIKDKYVNENKKGRKITNLKDTDYLSQIIAKIV